MVTAILSALGSVLLAVSHADSSPDAWLDAARRSVATVTTTLPDGSDSRGTAFVVGSNDTGLYFVTARHVVERGGANNQAKTVTLKLDARLCGGQCAVTADVETVHRDLDMAVLVLMAPAYRKGMLNDLRPLPVSPLVSADDAKKLDGAVLTAVGRSPAGEAEIVPFRDLRVQSATIETIAVQTSSMQGGESGSPVFTAEGRLVGMANSVTAGNVSVMPFTRIKARLDNKSWKTPINLVGGVAEVRVSPDDAILWVDGERQTVKERYFLAPGPNQRLKLTRGNDEPVEKVLDLQPTCIKLDARMASPLGKWFWFWRWPLLVASVAAATTGAVYAGAAHSSTNEFYRNPSPGLQHDAKVQMRNANILLWSGGIGAGLFAAGHVTRPRQRSEIDEAGCASETPRPSQ